MTIKGGQSAFADPDLCTIRVKADMPPERGTALESVIGHFADHPPFWIDESWKSELLVGTLKTERSKPRTSVIGGASSTKVIRAVRRPRTTELTGVSVVWLPPGYTGGPENPWTNLSMHFYGPMVSTFDGPLPEGVRSDPRLGPMLLDMTVRMVAAGGTIASGGGWFGRYEFEPFLANQGVAPWKHPGRGYSYIMCFDDQEIAQLGGMDTFAAAPIERSQPVHTADGEQCIVTLLAEAPATITDAQLRAWKDFLRPLLAVGVERRREHTHGKQAWGPEYRQQLLRPPLVLPEDWPEIA
ncbi:MAG: hypothetical protein AB7L17_04810 [Ilumatobacteraceae bacterium]